MPSRNRRQELMSRVYQARRNLDAAIERGNTAVRMRQRTRGSAPITGLQQAINRAVGISSAGTRRRESNRVRQAMLIRSSNT